MWLSYKYINTEEYFYFCYNIFIKGILDISHFVNYSSLAYFFDLFTVL